MSQLNSRLLLVKLSVLQPFSRSYFCLISSISRLYGAGNCWLRFSGCLLNQLLLQGVTGDYKGLRGVTRGYKRLQEVTRGYKRLEGITGGFKGLQGVTRDYRRIQGVTGGYKGLQGVTRGYKRLQMNWNLRARNTNSLLQLRLTHCCTQFKPFGSKTFCFRNFHII